MGAGKTTISDYLSTMFDMDIVEMDQVIAEREEMSISDIFATYGEEYFRDLETNLLIEMQSHMWWWRSLKREKCGRDEEERKSGSSYRYTGDHLRTCQRQ